MNSTNIFLKSYQCLTKLKKQYYHIHRSGEYEFKKDIMVIEDNPHLLEVDEKEIKKLKNQLHVKQNRLKSYEKELLSIENDEKKIYRKQKTIYRNRVECEKLKDQIELLGGSTNKKQGSNTKYIELILTITQAQKLKTNNEYRKEFNENSKKFVQDVLIDRLGFKALVSNVSHWDQESGHSHILLEIESSKQLLKDNGYEVDEFGEFLKQLHKEFNLHTLNNEKLKPFVKIEEQKSRLLQYLEIQDYKKLTKSQDNTIKVKKSDIYTPLLKDEQYIKLSKFKQLYRKYKDNLFISRLPQQVNQKLEEQLSNIQTRLSKYQTHIKSLENIISKQKDKITVLVEKANLWDTIGIKLKDKLSKVEKSNSILIEENRRLKNIMDNSISSPKI
jgi:hypothetical protein